MKLFEGKNQMKDKKLNLFDEVSFFFNKIEFYRRKWISTEEKMNLIVFSEGNESNRKNC